MLHILTTAGMRLSVFAPVRTAGTSAGHGRASPASPRKAIQVKKAPLLYNLSVLKSERTLEELAELLKIALSKCWNRQTRALLMELLSEVRALGERTAATSDDVDRIEEKAAKYLGVGLAEAARQWLREVPTQLLCLFQALLPKRRHLLHPLRFQRLHFFSESYYDLLSFCHENHFI